MRMIMTYHLQPFCSQAQPATLGTPLLRVRVCVRVKILGRILKWIRKAHFPLRRLA